MLSRFSLCGGQGLKKVVVNFQPLSAITTSAVVSSSSPSGNTPASNYPPEYPPPGPKRDFINYPRLSPRDRPPPVRLGFIPDSWFQAFYSKTGYTGPYMFLATVGTFMWSKEIVVYDHNMVHCISFILLVWFIQFKFGDKIKAFYDNFVKEELEKLDGVQEKEKQILRNQIKIMEGRKAMKDAIVEITKARTEVVQMQMEVSFRERVLEAYKSVKNKLDCQAELENLEKRTEQKIVVDYVMQNVMKSITPELENNVMKNCISDLNALAAKA